MGSFPIYPFREKVKFWNNRPGLTTTWNYNLAYALAKIPDLEVHFLTHAPLLRTKVLEDKGLFIHFVGHLPKLDKIDRITNLQYGRFNMTRHLRALDPDIVHGSGTDHEYGYIAVESGYPHVVTVHGVMKEVGRTCPPARNSVVWNYIAKEPSVIKQTDYLIAINPYVEQQFPEFSGVSFQISNAISPEFFSRGAEQIEKTNDLLFAGSVYPLKRVKNILAAMHQLRLSGRKVSLRVAGGVSNSVYMSELETFIQQHELSDCVTFLGPLPQAEIAHEMQKSRCLVLPSIQETAPMVIAEAQVMGLPVIATDVGGIKYMVEDGVSGFVIEPDNIDMLADRIEKILSDKPLRESMSSNARKAAMQYHPDVVAEKTAAVYREILRKRSDVSVLELEKR